MIESPDPPSRHVLGLPLIAVATVAAVAIAAAVFFIVSSLTSSDADEQQVYVEQIDTLFKVFPGFGAGGVDGCIVGGCGFAHSEFSKGG